MTVALSLEKKWTADEFVVQDQHDFGDAWRYELIDGQILAHAAPAPEHGAILAGLIGAFVNRAAAMPRGCRPEAGSAATPRTAQRNTARLPDLVIRCGEHPKVSFEVVSPSEIRDWRARDLKRQHMQAVEGMREIVELFQEDYAVHVYRLSAAGAWTFEALGGAEAVLQLESVGVSVTLAEIYAFAIFAQPAA